MHYQSTYICYLLVASSSQTQNDGSSKVQHICLADISSHTPKEIILYAGFQIMDLQHSPYIFSNLFFSYTPDSKTVKNMVD